MKLGITFEGGANRGIFSSGVADAFLEEDLMPDYFIGVSAGIAFGVSYLSKQKGRNWEIVEKYIQDQRYMGIRHLLNRSKRTYYNVDFVFSEIPDQLVPFDYESFARYPGEVVACMTNIHSGKAEYLPIPRTPEMNNYLAASCSLPVLFQPVQIKNHYYLDGALADAVPFAQAIKAGCDKNIVVLTRPREYVKKSDHGTGITKALYWKYPKIVETLKTRVQRYRLCMQKIRDMEQAGELYVIAPNDSLGIRRTETDIEKLRGLYQQGYDIAKENIEKIKEYIKS